MNNKRQDDVSFDLLKEFNENRIHIKEMISDLENIRSKVDKLFPESIDKRYIRFFEEKMKVITNLFNTILDMRKEISKSVQVEIEIRKKINFDDDFKLDDILDIRKIAKRVEALGKNKEKSKEGIDNVKK